MDRDIFTALGQVLFICGCFLQWDAVLIFPYILFPASKKLASKERFYLSRQLAFFSTESIFLNVIPYLSIYIIYIPLYHSTPLIPAYVELVLPTARIIYVVMKSGILYCRVLFISQGLKKSFILREVHIMLIMESAFNVGQLCC